MIKKVNKNKFGIIEYSITNEEDLEKLPKGDTDNTVYAVDDNNKVYLYSKKANDYILINGGGASNPNEVTIKRISMKNTMEEVDYRLFDGSGYYSVTGSICGNMLSDSMVYVIDGGGSQAVLTLYEYCKYVMVSIDESGAMQFIQEQLFASIAPIGKLTGLPSELQDCGTLVEAITRIYNKMTSPS